MSDKNHKPSLEGCSVLPPLVPHEAIDMSGTGSSAKGKPVRRNAAGRFAVLNAFIDFTVQELSRAELAVWLILFRDTKSDGLVRTSQADIARRGGMNVRSVKRAIAELQARGLLRVVRRGRLETGPSTYRLQPLATMHMGTPAAR